MPIIGKFTRKEDDFVGSIETLSIKAEVYFEANPRKTGNKPDYRALFVTGSLASEIGAAWKKTSKDGAEYLSVTMDDPVFPARVHCRLVSAGAQDLHLLYWDRPQPKSEQ